VDVDVQPAPDSLNGADCNDGTAADSPMAFINSATPRTFDNLDHHLGRRRRFVL
jgi:hypothetical protein